MTGLDILVVDDDRDFAETLGEVLELHGHSVEVAFTGEQAVARFLNRDYDVAIMDVRLPGRNGAESLLAIREAKPCARVIMMTGYSMEHLLRNALDRGAWAVLHKPLDMAQLLPMLDDIGSAPRVEV